MSLVVSNDKFPIRCVAGTSDIFSIGKLVPSLHGPWSLDCCAKGLGLLSLEIVCNLQMMAVHCFMACVAIICIVAVTCHLWPLFVCSSSCFLVYSLVPFCMLHGAFWCVASCHFLCSSSCFFVCSFVPFCVLQFVLFGVYTPSCHFVCVCSSSCFLVYSFVPFCMLQFVLFGSGIPLSLQKPVSCDPYKGFCKAPFCKDHFAVYPGFVVERYLCRHSCLVHQKCSNCMNP